MRSCDSCDCHVRSCDYHVTHETREVMRLSCDCCETCEIREVVTVKTDKPCEVVLCDDQAMCVRLYLAYYCL